MTITYKRALQPDHPSAKRVGEAISPPPCERGIPVYPMRYGIADHPLDRDAFPTLSVDHYPALQGGKSYGLRLLRPGSYLYLFYFQHGRMKTRHYLVTEDIRFAHLWWTPTDYSSQAPGSHARPDMARATHYVLAPAPSVADTLYLMVSETLLSHATLWQIEQDEGGLRSQLATTLLPSQAPTHPHVFDSAHVISAMAELKISSLTGVFPTFPGASQRPEFMPVYRQALSNLARHLGPGTRPLAVALHDPLGVVSELHHLLTLSVEKKTRYTGQHAHRLQSANFIAGYFNTASKEAPPGSDTASSLDRQRKLVDYQGAMDFPGLYAKEVARLDATIEVLVQDIIAWTRLIGSDHLLGKALGCFDLEVTAIANAYEDAVFDCIGGLVHSKAGQQQLEQVVMLPPGQSPFWRALSNGNKTLATRLKDATGDIAKNLFSVVDNYLEEHVATPATNALIGLLQALPATHQADVLVRRLRHVMEIRFNATIVMYDISLADLMRYSREFQGHQAPRGEYLKTWKLPEPKVSHMQLTTRVRIYDWVKIGETTYQKMDGASTGQSSLPPSRSIQVEGNLFIKMLNKLRSAGGYLFTGVGGYLAISGFTNALRQFQRQDEKMFHLGYLAGATLSLASAIIETGALGTTAFATLHNNANLKITAKILSAKFGMARLATAGAGVISFLDALRAADSLYNKNPTQAAMYLGAAFSSGLMALASWGGGTALAIGLTSAAVPVTVLGLTPVAWAIVALAAFGLGIAFMVGVDTTKHGAIDIWLKHSAWGIHHRQYTNLQELEAVHSLYYRPRLSAQWNQTFGSTIGTLHIQCHLPETQGTLQDQFQIRLKVKLDSRNLRQINGPIAYAPEVRFIDYRFECIVSSIVHSESLRSWSIQMHQDSQVSLEFMFMPNIDQPDLLIFQHDAPTPLTFTSSGLLSEIIDPARLEPVRPPK
ncbi:MULTISPECIES: toxin VasX [Pseudomonas]|uniref:toxin VasX n=1 Tax=Pseudomonas guariconensis TaxID=1288410 RepID=UPI002097BEBD|nr:MULTISPECIES: toxin VasX [Pseudomonas]MCO7596370.1 hypothetical protein [Pseudomonas guariconensis]MCU7219377.1 hypothetical protein [Pseudomonas brassicacearum]